MKKYLSPEVEIDLFKFSNSSITTISDPNMEIPDIEIDDDDEF